MSQNYEKLKNLLMELFQLDQPDLDFGIYRILHARGAEITQFLDKDLLPQVKAAFALYQPADKAALEKELAKLISGIEAAGMNPEDSPKVKELRARIAVEGVDLDTLEAEVYDHLYSFFRRYYSEGDFLSKRVYKPGVYAIPYEGEEVKLHWANADQYYIKTSEYLRDYAFRLHPENEKNPMRVHFRLVDAAEGEHGNVKEAQGKERRFKLAPAPFAAVEDGELVIRFTYEPDPAKQKELNNQAEEAILGLRDSTLTEWLRPLGSKHVRADGTVSDFTRLRVHLDRYTDRNTFDYFIHKDLGGFLRRELDFYIKNEVMHLDDIESETAPRVEQYISKIKVIRKIAGKIIDFLAQIEDFQKKLWLKKKFVVETSYCIRLGVIPEEFYPEIAANEAQREEWVRLCAIDEIKGDLLQPGYSAPLTVEFLKAQPTLMVDTQCFDSAFTTRLLAAIGDLDEQTDGVLVHSENFQALNLMQARYRERVKCVYIDPPYNTGNDGFCYRDAYPHSSWLSLLTPRLESTRDLFSHDGVLFSSIDDNEVISLRQCVNSVFGERNFIAQMVVQTNPKGRVLDQHVSRTHDYLLVSSCRPLERELSLPKSAVELEADYPEVDARGSFRALELRNTHREFGRHNRSNLWFPIYVDPATGAVSLEQQGPYKVEVLPRWDDGFEGCWTWGREKVMRQGENLIGRQVSGRWKVFRKAYSYDTNGFAATKKPKSILLEPGFSTERGQALLDNLLGARVFRSPKPAALLELCLGLALRNHEYCLDYFAGSGTTGHAVINLNREDGGQRKFILVEMADYFDTVLLPRLKKVTFSPEWKDGKPKRPATPEEAERSPRIIKVIRLESYEDTLNNLELRRTKEQQGLLDLPEAQGPDRLKEQYILRYMLDVETRGSQSLLNIAAFLDPTAYTLKVKRPGSDESHEVNVDLLETFNWLIGLSVHHIAAPQAFFAEFERDSEGRLRLKGRLKQDTAGRWWFRAVIGTTPDGRKTLVLWRNRPGGETAEGIEQDNLVLDEWFTKQGYSSKDSEFDLIYVNGDNNLENLKAPDDTWKVRLIEEDFFRLMFETEDA